MLSGQSAEAVCWFQTEASNLEQLAVALGGTMFSVVLFFTWSRVAGAIIGEYAKEFWFSRFKLERKKLKDEVVGLKSDVYALQFDVNYAAKQIKLMREENNRLLLRLMQAEDFVRNVNKFTSQCMHSDQIDEGGAIYTPK